MENGPDNSSNNELKPINQDLKNFEFVEPSNPAEQDLIDNGYYKIKDKRTGVTLWYTRTPEFDAYMTSKIPGKTFQGVRYVAMNGEATVGGEEEMARIREAEEEERYRKARLGEIANKEAENSEGEYTEATQALIDEYEDDDASSNFSKIHGGQNPKNKERRDRADKNPNFDHKAKMEEEEKRKDTDPEYKTPETMQSDIEARTFEGSAERALNIAEQCMNKPNALQTYYTEGALDYIARGISPFKKPGVVFNGFENLERTRINDVARGTAKNVWGKIIEDSIVPMEVDDPKEERELYDRAYVVATTIGAEQVSQGHTGDNKIRYSLPVVEKGEEFVNDQLSKHGLAYNYDLDSSDHNTEVYETFRDGFTNIIDALKVEKITNKNRDELFRVADFYFGHLLQLHSLDDASIAKRLEEINEEAKKPEHSKNQNSFREEKANELNTELSNKIEEIVGDIEENYEEAEDTKFSTALSSFVEWYNDTHKLANNIRSGLSLNDQIDFIDIVKSIENFSSLQPLTNLDVHPINKKANSPSGGPNTGPIQIVDTSEFYRAKVTALGFGLDEIRKIPNIEVLKTVLNTPQKVNSSNANVKLDETTGEYVDTNSNEIIPPEKVRHSAITELKITDNKNGGERIVYVAEGVTNKQSSAFIFERLEDGQTGENVFSINGTRFNILARFHHTGHKIQSGVDKGKLIHDREDFNRVWDRAVKFLKSIA